MPGLTARQRRGRHQALTCTSGSGKTAGAASPNHAASITAASLQSMGCAGTAGSSCKAASEASSAASKESSADSPISATADSSSSGSPRANANGPMSRSESAGCSSLIAAASVGSWGASVLPTWRSVVLKPAMIYKLYSRPLWPTISESERHQASWLCLYLCSSSCTCQRITL